MAFFRLSSDFRIYLSLMGKWLLLQLLGFSDSSRNSQAPRAPMLLRVGSLSWSSWSLWWGD